MPQTVIRTGDGKVVRLADHGDYPLHSSALLQSNQSADASIFTYGLGALVTGGNTSSVKATKVHTNVPDTGRMPAAEEMLVFSVGIEFPCGTSLTAMRELLDDVYFELFIDGSKSYVEQLARHLPPGSGLYGVSTENATGEWSNGMPIPSAARQLAVPHLIEGNSTYSGKFSEPGGALVCACADILARANLRGFRKRKVQ
jgi:hypothetical protein